MRPVQQVGQSSDRGRLRAPRLGRQCRRRRLRPRAMPHQPRERERTGDRTSTWQGLRKRRAPEVRPCRGQGQAQSPEERDGERRMRHRMRTKETGRERRGTPMRMRNRSPRIDRAPSTPRSCWGPRRTSRAGARPRLPGRESRKRVGREVLVRGVHLETSSCATCGNSPWACLAWTRGGDFKRASGAKPQARSKRQMDRETHIVD